MLPIHKGMKERSAFITLLEKFALKLLGKELLFSCLKMEKILAEVHVRFMKLSISPIIREKSLMCIQGSFSTRNPLRNVAVMKIIELPQRPLKMFQALTKNEHGRPLDCIMPFICNQLQENSMVRPHIKEFEGLLTHQLPRVERNSGRRMIRECPRIIKVNMN
jgi:hypothetical protein